MQTFTFYASEDKLANRGHTAGNIGVIILMVGIDLKAQSV